MYQCEASCEEILKWFHRESCREEILLLWLGPAKDDERLLYEIINNTNVIDSVIQDRVAFLLVGGSGKVTAARIGEFGPVFTRMRDQPTPTGAGSKKLVARTQAGVADFAMALGINPRRLPAIAIVTKHVGEVFVAAFHGKQDFPALKTWLLALQECVAEYRDELETVVMPDPLVVERLQAYQGNAAEVDGRIQELAAAVDRFLRYHPEQAADFPRLRVILTRPGPFDTAGFEAAWNELDAALQQPGQERISKQLPRTRVTRALTAIKQAKLPELPDKFPDTIMAARANALAANSRFEQRIRTLAEKGIKAGMVVPKSIKNGAVLPKLNRQLYQIVRLIALLEKLFPNIHIS